MNKELYLRSRGWVLVASRRQGMILIRRWSKPGTDWQGVNQGVAYKVQRDTDKWHKDQGRIKASK